MKVKILKTVVIAFALLMVYSYATAQKMTTYSGNIQKKLKAESDDYKKISWIIKVGGGFMGNSGWRHDYNCGYRGAYNISFGMQYRFNQFGLYVGWDVGSSMTRANSEIDYTSVEPYYNDDYNHYDYYDHHHSFIGYGIGAGPKFGLCHTVGNNLQIDASLGANYLYVLQGKAANTIWRNGIKYEISYEHERQRHMIAPEVNLGLWYRNVLFSLSYTPTIRLTGGDDVDIFCHRAFFNLGYRF